MNDSLVSHPAIAATCLWTTVGVLIAAAWVLRIVSPDLWHWSALFGLTAGALAPVAAVAHIKVYSVRVGNLVRNTAALPAPRGIRN